MSFPGGHAGRQASFMMGQPDSRADSSPWILSEELSVILLYVSWYSSPQCIVTFSGMRALISSSSVSMFSNQICCAVPSVSPHPEKVSLVILGFCDLIITSCLSIVGDAVEYLNTPEDRDDVFSPRIISSRFGQFAKVFVKGRLHRTSIPVIPLSLNVLEREDACVEFTTLAGIITFCLRAAVDWKAAFANVVKVLGNFIMPSPSVSSSPISNSSNDVIASRT